MEESEDGLRGRLSNHLLLKYLEDTPPFYFLSPGNQTSLEEENIQLPVLYSSANNLNVTLAAEGLPNGLQISDEGLISGTVDIGSSSDQPYIVEIFGVDSQGNADTLTFDWMINKDKGNWLSIGEQLAPRSEHGYVAVDSFFYLIGGLPNGSVMQFDPDTGYWAEKATPPLAFHHIQPVAIAEKIYIVSGWTGSYDNPDPLTHVYIYDTSLDTWSIGPEIPVERQRSSAGVVSANGWIYILGGALISSGNDGLVLDQFDRYDPISNTWMTLPSLPEKRSDFQAVVEGDTIYTVGGRESGGENFQDSLLPAVHAYDISGSVWLNNLSTLPTPRSNCMTAVIEGMLYVAGGDTGNPMSESITEALDLTTLEWKDVAEMYTGVHGSKAVVYENKIYVSAGSSKTGFGPEPLTQQVYTPSIVNLIPPELTVQPEDQFVKANHTFNYSLPSAMFISRNPERENLQISSSLWNGDTLPDWLTFDPMSFSYEGIPEETHLGSYYLKITASDHSLSTDAFFAIHVIEDIPDPIRIVYPGSDTLLHEPDTVHIITEVNPFGGDDPSYIRVINSEISFNKFRLGYDSDNLFGPGFNVLENGNDKVEITLKDFDGFADWNKIQIRPQGNADEALVVASYVSEVDGIGSEWKKIIIPISDFSNPDAFLDIGFIEFPYSQGAGSFDVGIQKIEFTGGSTPFLWFGDEKSDNDFQGSGENGELLAQVFTQVFSGEVQRVDFFVDEVLLSSDTLTPYEFDWIQPPIGTYEVFAKSINDADSMAVSEAITIEIKTGTVATITVTTAIDSLDGDTTSIANLIATPGTDGKISLREAIIAANHTANKDTIKFAIDSLDSGFNDTSWVIQQRTQYPKITDPICIDGYSQPGTQMNELIDTSGQYAAINTPHELAITLRGLGTAIGDSSGLFLTNRAIGSTIQGLVVQKCRNGIINFADSLLIIGNYFGTSASGLQPNDNRNNIVTQANHTTICNNLIAGYDGPSDSGILIGIQDDSLQNIDIRSNIFSCDVNGGSFGEDIPNINISRFQDYAIYIDRGVVSNLAVSWNLTKFSEHTAFLGETNGSLNNFTYANNYVDSVGESALYVVSGTFCHAKISNNFLGFADDWNIYFNNDTMDQVLVSDNQVTGNDFGSSFELRTDYIRNTSMINNRFDNTSENGIEIILISGTVQEELHNLLIRNNEFENMGAGGILITKSSSGSMNSLTIDSNRISNCTDFGIEVSTMDVAEAKNFDISNNVITKAKGGIKLSAENTSFITDVLIEENTIYKNGGNGIELTDDVLSSLDSVMISQNKIFNNQGLGIDLGSDQVSINDANDSDTGPNGLQNFPVLDSAFNEDNMTTIGGSLHSEANQMYFIEFFVNPVANTDTFGIAQDSAYGEGATYIGRDTVVTDLTGIAVFTSTFPTTLPDGSFITATSTAQNGSTSEFAKCILSNVNGGLVELTWLGLEDTNWNNIINWSPQYVPGFGTTVRIPSAFHDPVIQNGVVARAGSLTVEEYGHLLIEASGILNTNSFLMTIEPLGRFSLNLGGQFIVDED